MTGLAAQGLRVLGVARGAIKEGALADEQSGLSLELAGLQGFVNRSWTRPALSMLRTPNAALRWVLLGASVFLCLALVVPFAQRLFRFAPLHPADLALSLGAGFVCVLWFEVLKRAKRRAAGSI